MSSTDHHTIRLETAVSALPELEDLRGLRAALVEASRPGEAHARGSASRLAIVDKRAPDLGRVRERIPALAERVRDRTELVMSMVLEALEAIAAGDEAEAARRLIRAGEVEESHDRLDEAGAYYEKALELGRRPRDRSGEGLALRRLGRVARRQGRLEAALRFYTRSGEVAEDSLDAVGTVIALLGAGHVLADQGDWKGARASYLRAVEQLTDRSTPEFVHLCSALSVAERRLGDLSASEAWLERGEAEVKVLQEESAAGYLDHARAKLHLARGEVEAAESVFRTALQKPLEPVARVIVLFNLAEALLEGDRLVEAESSARLAEEEAIARGDLAHLPHVYSVLGRLAGRRGDSDGFVFFEQALDIIRDQSLPEVDRAAIQREYGLFEALLGNVEPAVARLRIAEEIHRSLGSEWEAHRIEGEIRRIRDESPEPHEDEDGND